MQNSAPKQIEKLLAPGEPHFVGNGFLVNNFIPSGIQASMDRMDPFLLLDYNKRRKLAPSDRRRGVGVHPHRGFETVTIAYRGRITHRDSAGGGGTIAEGDVQWMTAGAGLLHEEYHEEGFTRSGGDFQMVQLWVNLPAKYKKHPPRYQGISKDSIPAIPTDSRGSELRLIAGTFNGVQGPAQTFSEVHLSNVALVAGGEAVLDFPAGHHCAALVVEGAVAINQQDVPQDHFVLFKNIGERIHLQHRGDSSATVLLMAGAPLGEPIAAQGPFVMNTREELLEAITDFEEGRFGRL